MKKFAKFIATHSVLILVISFLLLVPAIYGYVNTRINYDILVYLPDSVDTIKGENILTDDFGLGAYAFVMVDSSNNKKILDLEKDIKKMEEEIEYRKLVVRKEAIEAVKEARAQGDLSENFEYYAAKKDKNKNESRIRYLERMIRTAKVVSDESKDDEVGLYNTVDVYFEDDDETETYKIVTTIRGNSLKGLISSESPLGRALLGHKVGDRVHVQVNDRAGYDVIIKRLEKTVDDGSDAIRSF